VLDVVEQEEISPEPTTPVAIRDVPLIKSRRERLLFFIFFSFIG
jgi:hypothetical protein